MVHFFIDFNINFFIFLNEHKNAIKDIIIHSNFFIIVKVMLHV